MKKHLLISLAIFAALASVNYFPVFRGKVPFPAYIVEAFPPWADAASHDKYAELGDTATMFYPWRTFTAASMQQLTLPLWNHHILAGTPFVSNASSAVFYPVNFLYYVLPIQVAWSLRLILQIILAGCFMSLFVRSIGGSLAGSIVAGIIYSFCGYLTG